MRRAGLGALFFMAACVSGNLWAQDSASLDAGAAYEQLGQWKDAEAQYLVAAKESSPEIRKKALSGIVRVRRAADADLTDPELAAAQHYESDWYWSKAEDKYLAALKSSSHGVRSAAQEGLERVRGRLTLQRWSDRLALLLGYGATVAGFATLLALLLLMNKTRKSVDLTPFAGTSEGGGKQIAFWLSYVRAQLKFEWRPTALPAPGIAAPMTLFFALPEFRDELPDAARDIEIAGVKLPLADLVGIVARPRVKVMGGVNITENASIAFADVTRRPNWRLGYRQNSIIVRELSDTPGAAQDADLELFAYTVLINAVKANAD